METITEKKKGGNPNFVKKEVNTDKLYEFELIQTFEKYKPTDEAGNKVSDLYPPVYGLPNKGLAYDEKTKKQRAWRYIRAENSIWIDEQREIETAEEAYILSDMDNQLTFLKGKLLVRGIETNKLEALKVMDMFEGKEVQLNQVPRVYRLLNPDAIATKIADDMDAGFEAEKAAREATEEQMYEVASSLGITIGDNPKAVRNAFILAARTNPTFFMKQFVNPLNKFAYSFKKALDSNVISATQQKNQLTWFDSGAVIMEINTAGDVVADLATQAFQGKEAAVKLFHQLQAQ